MSKLLKEREQEAQKYGCIIDVLKSEIWRQQKTEFHPTLIVILIVCTTNPINTENQVRKQMTQMTIF